MDLEFIKVNMSQVHIKILYKLLKEREYNISHTKMPSFEEHMDFVFNNPYKEWFLVKYNNIYIGSFFIQNDNSIGIKINSKNVSRCIEIILNYIIENFKPIPAIKSKIPERFYLNVPYEDKNFQNYLCQIGYKPNQISYLI